MAVAAALVTGGLLLALPDAGAAQGELTDARRIAIAQRLQASSVSVRAGSSSGSGFVVGPERWVVTNAHVVRGAGRQPWVQVRFGDGRFLPARILAMVPTLDLAIVDPEGEVPAPPLPLGPSDEVRVGQTVLAFGSPYGLDGTLTQGIVSARRRLPGAGRGSVRELIQTDAPINPGNSGGPLVDADGRVIGVNTAILSRTGGSHGIGFAVPSAHVAELLDELRRSRQGVAAHRGAPGDRRASPPATAAPGGSEAGGAGPRDGPGTPSRGVWLGLVVDDLADDDFAGVRVRQAVAEGPAYRAGLRGASDPPPPYVVRRRIPWTGHIIVAIDDTPVATTAELAAALRRRKPGERVTLTLSIGPDLVEGQAEMVLEAPPRE